MIPFRSLRARLIGGLLAGALCVSAAGAQTQPPPGPALSDYLTRLAANPRDSLALVGAGEAALAMGDPQGAVSFFARAEEIRPRDGRVKAGLGSALVHLGQPHAAIRFFDEAQGFGLPAADMAKDRGMAYDLIGDPRRAQREYRLGLQAGPDEEISRNLALSLAISGDRAGALQVIDPQVRNQDRAAWRARAFILALTGDTLGATQAAAGVMRAEQAEAMRPFFERLPRLNLAQRAMAVHLGEMPPEGQGAQIAGNFTASQPLAADEIGVLSPGSGEARQDEAETQTSPLLRRRPVATGSAIDTRSRNNRSARATTPAAASAPSRTVTAAPAPQSLLPAQIQASGPPALAATSSPRPSAQPAPGIMDAELPASAPARAPVSAPTPAPARSRNEFASISDLVVALPDEPPAAAPPSSGPPRPAVGPSGTVSGDLGDVPRIVRAPGREPVVILPPSDVKSPAIQTAEAKPAPKAAEKRPAAKKAEPAKPAEPSRIWVQIAGGANKASLPRELKRLQDKAPKLLRGRTGWTTPLRATNRLLVGPFKTDAEARRFVNDLAAEDLTAFSWTSPEGQKIEKLAAK